MSSDIVSSKLECFTPCGDVEIMCGDVETTMLIVETKLRPRRDRICLIVDDFVFLVDNVGSVVMIL